jgi:hypothetical protein
MRNEYFATTATATTATASNNNVIKNNIYFSRFSVGEGKTHPTMKHSLILSLISKHNVLISSGNFHCNINSSTTICNTNIGKI